MRKLYSDEGDVAMSITLVAILIMILISFLSEKGVALFF